MRPNKITWAWAMPHCETFTIAPIRERVEAALVRSKVSIDPFARKNRLATYSNDIDPNCRSEYCMEAREFLRMLVGQGVTADLILLDPPYSPTQIKRAYESAGLAFGSTDAQNAKLLKDCRELIAQMVRPGSVVISCGWNSTGMCAPWIKEEVLVVNHGAAHNDTICTTSFLP